MEVATRWRTLYSRKSREKQWANYFTAWHADSMGGQTRHCSKGPCAMVRSYTTFVEMASQDCKRSYFQWVTLAYFLTASLLVPQGLHWNWGFRACAQCHHCSQGNCTCFPNCFYSGGWPDHIWGNGDVCWNRISWDVIPTWNRTFQQGIVLDHWAVKTCQMISYWLQIGNTQ